MKPSNHRRMLCQQLRTIRRDGVLYTPEPITLAEWKAKLRAAVRRRCGDCGLYGAAETAVVLYCAERDGTSYGAAIRRHIGATKTGEGPAGLGLKRLAKWRARAAKAKGV